MKLIFTSQTLNFIFSLFCLNGTVIVKEFVFLALQPTVDVYSQPGSGL